MILGMSSVSFGIQFLCLSNAVTKIHPIKGVLKTDEIGKFMIKTNRYSHIYSV